MAVRQNNRIPLRTTTSRVFDSGLGTLMNMLPFGTHAFATGGPTKSGPHVGPDGKIRNATTNFWTARFHWLPPS